MHVALAGKQNTAKHSNAHRLQQDLRHFLSESSNIRDSPESWHHYLGGGQARRSSPNRLGRMHLPVSKKDTDARVHIRSSETCSAAFDPAGTAVLR